MRVRLGNMVDAGTICKAFEAEFGALDWWDLELLATVEDLNRSDNGKGR